MTSHQHSHCGDNSCGHSHGEAGHSNGEEDFNEFLEETHPCCQKDSESKARALKLRAALDEVDPSQVAERARKAAFSSGVTGLPPSRGCGQDYPALREARAEAAAKGTSGGGEGVGRVYGRGGEGRADGGNSEDSEDDDDDLDYLLDDPGVSSSSLSLSITTTTTTTGSTAAIQPPHPLPPEITRMAQARVEAMHADAARLHSLRVLGFGLHLEVPESELEAASKGSFRGAGVVVHLYDADSMLGASLDLLLEGKAGSYMGTRFVRCRLNPESPVASRMRIQRVPALACFKGGVRVAYTDQLSQFGNSSEGADPGAVDRWLTASGTLEFDPPNPNALREGGGVGTGSGGDEDGDGEIEEIEARYDCGLDGCHKAFKHDHFLAAGGSGLPQGFGERI